MKCLWCHEAVTPDYPAKEIDGCLFHKLFLYDCLDQYLRMKEKVEAIRKEAA